MVFLAFIITLFATFLITFVPFYSRSQGIELIRNSSQLRGHYSQSTYQTGFKGTLSGIYRKDGMLPALRIEARG